MISKNHLDLISSIYDLPLQPDKWALVLDQFSHVMNAFGSALHVHDPIYAESQVQEFSSVYQTMRNGEGVLLIDQYNEEVGKYDQAAATNLLMRPERGFVSDFELSGLPNMDQYLDHYPVAWNRENFGVTHRAASRLNMHGAWIDGISVQFPSNRGEISPGEKRTGAFFLDHFAKSIELGRAFGVLKSRFDGVFSALDRFHIGIFVLSPNASVVVRNREAERILDADDGLSLSRDGRLQPSSNGEQRGALKDAITKAIHTARGEHDSAETLLTLPRRSGEDPYLVEVAPIRDRDEIESQFSGCLVFVIDLNKTDVISTEGMQALYQLTGAESEICKLLAQGHTTAEMADTRNVSLETVRHHIKQILQKTGVKNRAQLVRLAHTVNLPIDPASGKD